MAGLEPVARSITEKAKQLLQVDLCTVNGFPDADELTQMAKFCIAEAVKWRLEVPMEEEEEGADEDVTSESKFSSVWLPVKPDLPFSGVC